MKILFIGDVYGPLGRRILAERLKALKKEHAIDLCIANGENTAGGKGISHAIVKKMRKYGVDVITGGNHSFDCGDGYRDLAQDDRVLRPHNYPQGNLGKGITFVDVPGGTKIAIVNLLGRTFFAEHCECPFRMMDALLPDISAQAPVVILDFHAEASSEKKTLAAYLDGRISALIGTHTHVQTADEIVSPNGTAYITDVGMTGSEDSIIGVKKEQAIRKYLLQTKVRYEPADTAPMLNAVVIDINESDGKARSITRLYERVVFSPEGSSINDI